MTMKKYADGAARMKKQTSKTQHHFKQIIIPLLLTNTFDECMTLTWIADRAETVMKYVKGYLSEAAVELKSVDTMKYKSSGLTVQFVLPVNLNDIACERVRCRLLEFYRTTPSS